MDSTVEFYQQQARIWTQRAFEWSNKAKSLRQEGQKTWAKYAEESIDYCAQRAADYWKLAWLCQYRPNWWRGS